MAPTLQVPDLHMELCDFNVHFNTPRRPDRRPVNGIFVLSVQGSHRGERLLSAVTIASRRLQTAVTQHKGLRELGVTFRMDRALCSPHLIVHK